MKNPTTINEALVLFEYSAKEYTEATLLNNYKGANKSCKKIAIAISYLRDNSQLKFLRVMFKNEDPGVRTWAATYLLPTDTEESIIVLGEVGKLNNILGLDARIVLEQFLKDNNEYRRSY